MTTTTTNGRPPFAEYVKAGLSAFPVRADGSKAPAVAWSAYQERRPTPEEAESWAGRFHGVAIAGGAVSGGLEVIDVDEPDLVRPFLSLVKDESPDLYARLCLIRTPRRNEAGQGGCHVVYRVDGAVPGNTKLAMDGEPKPKTLIETRGEHGYIVTVGSAPKCHASGRVYEHVGGPPLTALSTITAGERDLLHRIARTFDRSIASTHRDNGRERVENRSPGDDYASQVSWEDILTPHGWRPVRTVGDTTQWCRPGKETGISATTGLKSGSGNELLVVFSTNAAPFEGINQAGRPGATYTKFAAYALLNHGGDYREAARALARLGYGDKRDGHAEYEREMGDQGSEPRDTGETREDKPKAPRFVGVTCRELASAKYDVRFIIDNTLVELQPCLFGGPSKGCKTLTAIDAAVSIATATPFLGMAEVPAAARVGFMSGEGGLPVLQDYGRRVTAGRGWRLEDVDGLVFCDTLPQLNDASDVRALAEFVTAWELAVIFLDPAYLAMPGDDAGNLMKMGMILRQVNRVCLDLGCTPVILHHLKKNIVDPFAPPELSDLAWAGFDAFAGQWWLLGRREKYDAEQPGEHRLWLNIGGRAGHSALHALDIHEGALTDPGGRRWDVEIGRASQARRDAEERAEASKTAKAETALQADLERLCKALARHPEGMTKTALRDESGVNYRLAATIAEGIDRGHIVACEVLTGNHKSPKPGYRLAE